MLFKKSIAICILRQEEDHFFPMLGFGFFGINVNFLCSEEEPVNYNAEAQLNLILNKILYIFTYHHIDTNNLLGNYV